MVNKSITRLLAEVKGSLGYRLIFPVGSKKAKILLTSYVNAPLNYKLLGKMMWGWGYYHPPKGSGGVHLTHIQEQGLT